VVVPAGSALARACPGANGETRADEAGATGAGGWRLGLGCVLGEASVSAKEVSGGVVLVVRRDEGARRAPIMLRMSAPRAFCPPCNMHGSCGSVCLFFRFLQRAMRFGGSWTNLDYCGDGSGGCCSGSALGSLCDLFVPTVGSGDRAAMLPLLPLSHAAPHSLSRAKY
jgi:hypothetical protein